MGMTDDERKTLGARVTKARLHAHLGKEAAARNAGVSSITWKRVEDGLRVQDANLAAVLSSLGLGDDEPPAGVGDDLREQVRRAGLSAAATRAILAILESETDEPGSQSRTSA